MKESMMSAEDSVATEINLIDSLTAGIVSAYVANNAVPASELPSLIRSVRAAFEDTSAAAPAEPDVERPTPAQIKKSITPDALISFIDGKPYKTLKRHLTTNGLEPHAYRQRYGLPVDYPMVCPSYSEQRSELARTMGLGQQRRNWPAKEDAPADAAETKAAPKRKKGDAKVSESAAA